MKTGATGTIQGRWNCRRELRAEILQPLQRLFSTPYFPGHRFPSISLCRGPTECPPFIFIFRLLNFQDWDLTTREARKVDKLRFENTKIMLFPDYSIDTQRLRRTFDHVKAQLRTRGLKYSMLLPASLWVVSCLSVCPT